MRVRILFFGLLKDLVGKSSDSLELPEGSSVRDVLEHYLSSVPKLKTSLTSIAVAVNQQYASAETKLKSDDEVALLPPVSGGSGKAVITRDAIQTTDVLARIKQGEDGAAVMFEGVVRNHTRGRRALYLDYEAYEEMALDQLESLAQQALKEFAIRDVTIVHRLGRLQIE